MTPYLPADDLDEIRDAHKSGKPIVELADRFGFTEAYLRRLLRLPEAKPAPTGGIDLWSVERLHAAL